MEERKQNCSQRDQYDDGPLGQCRDPEGKVLIEEAPPETFVLIGISRDAEINLGRSRELASLLEKPLFAMNLPCGIYQQVSKRGMETIAGCKHLFGANELDFSLRTRGTSLHDRKSDRTRARIASTNRKLRGNR
jgi:hypothetical protein